MPGALCLHYLSHACSKGTEPVQCLPGSAFYRSSKIRIIIWPTKTSCSQKLPQAPGACRHPARPNQPAWDPHFRLSRQEEALSWDMGSATGHGAVPPVRAGIVLGPCLHIGREEQHRRAEQMCAGQARIRWEWREQDLQREGREHKVRVTCVTEHI